MTTETVAAKTGPIGTKSTGSTVAKPVVAKAAVQASPAPKADSTSPVSTGPKKFTPKPDPAKFKETVETLNTKINLLKTKLDAAQSKLTGGTSGEGQGSDPASIRRKELKGKLDELVTQRNTIQESRSALFEQIKTLQASMKKKTEDVKASKDKLGYRSGDDCDKQINYLEKQITAGQVTLAEEKKIINEMSALRKAKKLLEKFGSAQLAIDGEKAKLDELRVKLGEFDVSRESLRSTIDGLRAELNALSNSQREKFESQSTLYNIKKGAKAELDAAFNELREVKTQYKDDNNAWYEWSRADQERKRAEFQAKAQEEKDERMRKVADRELENAEIPAFLEEIASCNSLIQHFTILSGGVVAPAVEEVASVTPTFNIRTVTGVPEGMILKKKEEESFMVMGKTNKKQNKSSVNKAVPTATAAVTEKSRPFRLDFQIIEELGKLKISLPSSAADVPTLITALQGKMTGFKESQAKQTAANKAAALAKIETLKAKVAAGEEVPELAVVASDPEQ